MAPRRKSLAEARITGAIKKNPARYKHREAPEGLGTLGDPPVWLKEDETCKAKTAWRQIATEVPWLNSSHRGHLTITCTLYGRLIAGQEIGVQAANLLRLCLSQMGATPADASKIPPPAEDPADEFDEFFD